ncbi:unnamed protein product [Brassica rapa subsp. narinosa]
MCLMGVQLHSDFFPGGSPNLRCGLLPWHAMLGLFVYIIAVGNAALGFSGKADFLGEWRA